MIEDFQWAQKYRPKTIKDTILPADTKRAFQKFVDEKNVPPITLVGTPGTGKTTAAMAMLDEIGADYIMINSSLDGGVDTLRNKVINFISSVSFSGGRKYVILDEADRLSFDFQQGLRNLTETYSKNAGFILTANYKNKLIDALQSRGPIIEFKIPNNQKQKVASQFFKRVLVILDAEGVEYDKAVVAEVVNKYFPDFRRTLNQLQIYVSMGGGKIDSGILTNLEEQTVKELVKLVAEKNYTEAKKWVKNNLDSDANSLYTTFYEVSCQYMDVFNQAQLVTNIAQYQYWHAFAANQEINFLAFLASVMRDCNYNGL